MTTHTSAIAIGVNSPALNDWGIAFSLDELIELAKTAGIHVHSTVYQTRDLPHPRTYIGSGKLDEVREMMVHTPTDVILADDELAPSVQKRLESELGVPVLDRTGLILDIFAGRARTHEAQLQVELAQLEYQLPRLVKMWSHFGRASAGVGTKGMGETQLEVDKRIIGKRIATLKTKLEKVRAHRQSNRQKRLEMPVVTGSIIGYTNAGKSTLMNALTRSSVLSEDKLFATLDPTSRQLYLDTHDPVVLTDTVGFIKKLPHELVTSFRSTLEEAALSDFILHVVDVSHPQSESLIKTAQSILTEIGADTIPVVYVFNKFDCLTDPDLLRDLQRRYSPSVAVSALTGFQLDALKQVISELLAPMRQVFYLTLPYSQVGMVSTFRKYGTLLTEEYRESDIVVEVSMIKTIGQKLLGGLFPKN